MINNTKKNLYERFGLKELWLVDPVDNSATGYELVEGKYQSFFKRNLTAEILRSEKLNLQQSHPKMTQAETMRPPRTMLEAFERFPQGTLVQLIDNNLVMSPAPFYSHQRLLLELSAALLEFVKTRNLGVVCIAPFDVYLDDQNAFQPDICFVQSRNIDLLREKGLYGAPELVIEILSPGTARYDKHTKKNLYERFGVKELWLVDPVDNSATGYELVEGKYQPFFKETGRLESKLLDWKAVF